MHQPYGASLYQLRSDMSVRSVKTKLFCKTKGNALTKLKKKGQITAIENAQKNKNTVGAELETQMTPIIKK